MRSLLLALLASLGFVAFAAGHGSPQQRGPHVSACVQHERDSGAFTERAPLVPAPMRIAARSGRTSPASRLTSGSGGLVGEPSASRLQPARVERVSGSEPPRTGDSPQHRQLEGRGPPRGPSAA